MTSPRTDFFVKLCTDQTGADDQATITARAQALLTQAKSILLQGGQFGLTYPATEELHTYLTTNPHKNTIEALDAKASNPEFTNDTEYQRRAGFQLATEQRKVLAKLRELIELDADKANLLKNIKLLPVTMVGYAKDPAWDKRINDSLNAIDDERKASPSLIIHQWEIDATKSAYTENLTAANPIVKTIEDQFDRLKGTHNQPSQRFMDLSLKATSSSLSASPLDEKTDQLFQTAKSCLLQNRPFGLVLNASENLAKYFEANHSLSEAYLDPTTKAVPAGHTQTDYDNAFTNQDAYSDEKTSTTNTAKNKELASDERELIKKLIDKIDKEEKDPARKKAILDHILIYPIPTVYADTPIATATAEETKRDQAATNALNLVDTALQNNKRMLMNTMGGNAAFQTDNIPTGRQAIMTAQLDGMRVSYNNVKTSVLKPPAPSTSMPVVTANAKFTDKIAEIRTALGANWSITPVTNPAAPTAPATHYKAEETAKPANNFEIYDNKLETTSSTVDTFVAMLKSYIAVYGKARLPQITTDPTLESNWKTACQDPSVGFSLAEANKIVNGSAPTPTPTSTPTPLPRPTP